MITMCPALTVPQAHCALFSAFKICAAFSALSMLNKVCVSVSTLLFNKPN